MSLVNPCSTLNSLTWTDLDVLAMSQVMLPICAALGCFLKKVLYSRCFCAKAVLFLLLCSFVFVLIRNWSMI